MSVPGSSYAVNPAAGFLWNVFFSSLGDPLGLAVIDATGEKMAWSGPVWFQERTGTKSIRRVGFLFGAVTKAGGSALTVSLQNCSTSAAATLGGPRPDETQDQTVAIANADASFAANTWYRTGAFSADRSVAFGEMLSVVVEFDGGGRLGADSVAFNNLAVGEYMNGVALAQKAAGTWTQMPHYPNIVLEFDDGTFGTLQGGFPFSALANHAFNLGTLSNDEYALEFTVPVDMDLDGAGFLYARASGGAANSEGEVHLYDGTTSLASCQLRSIHVAGTGAFAYGYALFDEKVPLTGGQTYRLAVKPTVTGAGNNITLHSFTVNDANHFRAHVGGTTWCLATRVDSGAWSTSAQARPFIWPILSLAGGDGDAGDGGDIEPEPRFDNGIVTTGLTFMILTARSGDQYVWSDRPLPDPSTYYLGWKAPRVTQWGTIRRALSRFDGQYETSDFHVTLSDLDRLLRQLDADQELVNATVVVYMVSDEDRRALLPAKTVYRGVVRDAKPIGTLAYELTVKDVFEEAFSTNSNAQQVPERLVGQTDFANCAVTLVSSSAEAYVCDGATAGGATTVPVKNGRGSFAIGSKVTFGVGADVYGVKAASSTVVPDGLDPETSIDIEPALVSGVSNGDAVTQVPAHAVEAAIGKRVPIVYGYITDRVVSGGVDSGDGQGPLIYVGDKVGADGKTYGEFLWAGHACYAPSDRPFPMLYFWNESLDDIGNGSAFPSIGTLASEAGAGGRIGLPGYGCWTTTLGIATNYRDYNSRRYTLLYLRGIFRDWALGIRPAPVNLGGVPFAVAAYGAETVGDSSGSLITSGLQQYKHIVRNWIPPRGTSYQSGAWLASPFFADDPTLPMIDGASFEDAEAQGLVYAGVPFRGDFIIGANNEAITRRELLARLNQSFGVDCGFNRQTQFFVSMVNTDIGSTTLRAPLTYVRDIFAGTWAIDPITHELYTAIPYRHTQDYLGRSVGGWRSVDTGVLETENTAATAAYGSKSSSPEYLLYMVRGKNRASDPTDYDDGTDTAAAVLALKLARVSTIQHVPKWQTGPAGFNDELADVVPVTHYEGLSNVGWTDRPLRIERVETDPSNFTEAVESYDLDPML